MGHRLSKIYTRTGDDGTTGLGDGTRVPKDHARVEAFGTVDELNSVIGLLLTEPLPDRIRACLTEVQNALFDLGGELSIPGYNLITEQSITALEDILDELNSGLPPLKEFILPGGTRAGALCHLARAVCRRTERRVFTLLKQTGTRHFSLAYLNRLSDLLFVMARSLNKAAGEPETQWRHTK